MGDQYETTTSSGTHKSARYIREVMSSPLNSLHLKNEVEVKQKVSIKQRNDKQVAHFTHAT